MASPDATVPSTGAGQGDPLAARARAWLAADPDPTTRAELAALLEAGAWKAVADRFAGPLTFGTAGLRAELGAGPARMNRLVVRQAAAGLVEDLLATRPGHPIRLVVGHDARHRSADFAADTAAVAHAAGVEVRRFDRPVPTPVLAFAVRHLGADAGVMVTASHNPPADNGYKVYLADGAQIVPPDDERIAAAIARVAERSRLPVGAPPPPPSPPDDVVDAYLATVSGGLVADGPRSLAVVYTPLCGVGADVTLAVFERAGFSSPAVVASQARPDPDFPGLPFPNPEEPGVLDAALAMAREVGADLVLAHDPDADRLGVAVPVPGDVGGSDARPAGGWRALSGNEIGALLADHLLRHSDGADRLVVATVVSSRLVERLAEAAGVRYAATLTGFKWIVRPALAHPEWRFLFGYEEALGFSVNPAVRDKDGISASLLFAALTDELLAAGSSPLLRLGQLAVEQGLHATDQWSIRFPGRTEGPALASAVMARVRARPPDRLGRRRLAAVRDLRHGDGLPPADAVIWDFDDRTRVVFRPSGTEPKLKVYLEVIEEMPDDPARYEPARAGAADSLAALRAELAGLLDLQLRFSP